MLSRRSFAILSLVTALLAPFSALTQTSYPARPIRLIVPFPPGGGNDLLARVLAEKLSPQLGQPVIVENRPGAGGNVGAESVVRAPPDGHTLLLGTNTLAINPHINKSTSFDVRTDIAAIARLTTTPFVLIVPSRSPARSVGELIAQARENPGKLSYASVGVGSPHHLGMELLKTAAKIEITHVPYRGSGQALTDLSAGRTDLMLVTSNAAVPLAGHREIRILGVAERKRLAMLPEVPTLIEAGVTDFEVTAWYGLMVAAGTPQPIQQKLSEAVLAIIELPDVKERLIAIGFEITPAGRSETQRLLLAEFEKWGTIVRNAGIVPE